MAEVTRGMKFRISVETNKETYNFTGTSWHTLRRVLRECEIEGFAPAPARSRRTSFNASLDVPQRLALRTAAWTAFDELWRELRSNFGDFEDDYREWKSGGEAEDIDAHERAAYGLYAALVADTVACRSEDELLRLDRNAPPALAEIALEWFREDRASREAPHD